MVRLVPVLHAERRMVEWEFGCRTLVVSRAKRKARSKRYLVVRTPLEMINMLQEDRSKIETVVLTGNFAKNPELASFLCESYPTLRVLAGRSDEEPDTYLPTFA